MNSSTGLWSITFILTKPLDVALLYNCHPLCLQFYDYVVLQHLRPIVPADMPADYELLMESCWAASPSDRPSIVRVLDCLDAMIEERALQAAAEEVRDADDAADAANTAERQVANKEREAHDGIIDKEVSMELEAVGGVWGSKHSCSSSAYGGAVGEEKQKKRDALKALLHPRNRQRRPSGMQTHMMRSAGSGSAGSAVTSIAAAAARDFNSEPLPPVLASGGRGGSASSQQSSFSVGRRQSSETWLLQRSPASFSAGYANTAFNMFSSSFSMSTSPPLMMVGGFDVEEEGSCVSDAEQPAATVASDGGVVGVGKRGQDDAGKAVAASTAEEYFWVV
jgi:hypothetical protein